MPSQPTAVYADTIREGIRASKHPGRDDDATVALVEELIRIEYPTLDAMTAPRLRDEARQATDALDADLAALLAAAYGMTTPGWAL